MLLLWCLAVVQCSDHASLSPSLSIGILVPRANCRSRLVRGLVSPTPSARLSSPTTTTLVSLSWSRPLATMVGRLRSHWSFPLLTRTPDLVITNQKDPVTTAQNLATFVKTYSLDGVDIDMEGELAKSVMTPS